MFRRLGFAAAFFGAMVLALGTTAPVIADDLETGSSKFISSLAENAIGSLASKETERNERINRFRAMFVENFAVRSIGKFVLGRFWKKASEEEAEDKKTKPKNNNSPMTISKVISGGCTKPRR